MSKNKTKILNLKLLVSWIFIVVAMLACNLPASQPATEVDPLLASSTATVYPITETATPIPPTATQCLPSVTTNQDSNVRNGPSQVYDKLGYLPQGAKAIVDGKSSDGTWWYIQFAGGQNGHGWISGSIVTTDCIPNTLAVIAAPPIPVSQAKKTKTPKPSNTGNHNNQTVTPSPTGTQTQPSGTGELLFKVEFSMVWNCAGQPVVSAKIYNVGSAVIESTMSSVEANGVYINTTGNINNAPFKSSANSPEPSCAQNAGFGQGSLTPGENAFIHVNIASVPSAGTQGFLYVEACTDNDHYGKCTGQFAYFNF